MADTEFSGELMGLDEAVFNPHHSQKVSIVVEYVTPVITDMSLVDYLVHPGKNTMTQVFDPTIGDLPYHTVEVKGKTEEKDVEQEKREEREKKVSKDDTFHFSPIPKWYDTKTWNKMQVALKHAAPATCSIPHTPEYEIIHTAPTHARTPEVAIFEFPEPMTEATLVENIKRTTSLVISEIEEFHGEAYVYPKANSPFYGLTGMDLINAKLDFIGADKDWDKEEEEEEGENWKPYIDAEDYTTDPCRPHGRLSDEQFKDLWLDTEEAFYIPLSLQETQEEVEVPEFGDPEEIPDEEVHYRAGHWLGGDIVESLEPVKKVARRVIHMAKATFLSRTRIQSRRGGYLTMIQWNALFGGDAPEAVKTATSGVHPLAPLLGVKRVSAKIVAGLRLAGYRVEDVIPEGYRRRVTCLIVP